MKSKYITLLHHISGNYGVYMDKMFGYKDKHWVWYTNICIKHLKKP